MKSEWKECQLGDLITFQRGYDLPKTKMCDGEYPVVGSNGIIGYHNEYTTEAPSITVGRSGNVGTPFLYNGKSWSHNTSLYIKEFKDVYPLFIYYFLKTLDLKNYAGGSAVPTLNRNHIHSLNVSIPVDIDIQKKISSVLSALDDKIELNNRMNENLEQQAQAIFKSWFTDNPYLDSMPQVPLSDLCIVVTKGTTPTTLGKPFVSEGINFIKAESIQNNHAIDKNKFAFIDTETNSLLKRSIICRGDIVFTIAGTLGRFALIDDSVLPANTNQAVAIIRANTEKVMPEYLYSFFLGNWHNDYYTKRIQQAVQANLSLGTIKSLPIPILSDDAMKEYLVTIIPIITMTKANELEISRLEALRDTLLPKLMSGEIDVSNLDL